MFKPSDIQKQEDELAKKQKQGENLSFSKKQKKEYEQVKTEKVLLEEEKVYRRGIVTVKDIIAPAAMEVKPAFLRLGDKYIRTLFAMEYPRYISVGWFSPIINFS